MKRTVANRSLLHTHQHVPDMPGGDREPNFCPLPDPQDDVDRLIRLYHDLQRQLLQVRRKLQEHGVNPDR